MKIGVVGAGGFIGTALSVALASAGHEVVPFTRQHPVTSESGREAARGLDGVVWVASSNTPATVGTDPETANSEIDEFRRSMDVLGESGISRFILVSSGGTVYGRAPAPSGEDDELQPVSAYGRLKAEIEQIAREATGDSTILRLANVYGPGQLAKRGQGVLGHWLQAVADGRAPIIYGDPSVARDYIYIADCTEAIILALEDENSRGCTINIGSGVPTSLAELLDIVTTVTGTDIEARYDKSRPFDNASTWLSIDRARDILGWEPTTPLIEGVAAMWEWKVNR